MSNSKNVEAFYRLFGARLRCLRVKACKSQEDVAKAVGKTRAGICNIEFGHNRVPAHFIPMFADAVGCTVADLLYFPTEAAMAQLEWDEAVKACAGPTPAYGGGVKR